MIHLADMLADYTSPTPPSLSEHHMPGRWMSLHPTDIFWWWSAMAISTFMYGQSISFFYLAIDGIALSSFLAWRHVIKGLLVVVWGKGWPRVGAAAWLQSCLSKARGPGRLQFQPNLSRPKIRHPRGMMWYR
jgi:hypothetical protein